MRPILQDDDSQQYWSLVRRIERQEQRDDVMTGAVVLWRSGVAIPAGWLQLDGTTFNATTYPKLAELWATTTLPANPVITGLVAIVRAR